MSVVIPNAPQGGGDLAKYLTSVESEIGWMPKGIGENTQELIDALGSDKNDPATWVAFAAGTLQTVWEAMPSGIRDSVYLALRDLAYLGLARANDMLKSSADAAAAVDSAAEAIPFIGALIKAVLQVIDASVDYAKQIDSQNELFSEQDYWASRYKTISAYDHPDALVYKQMRVENYFDYNKKGNAWRYRPCFARSSGAADLMFLGVISPPDLGSCTKGVKMDCPSGSFFDWDECHYDDPDATRCTRTLSISSLFYPFWSSAYPDSGIIPVGPSAKLNPNTLLAANQYALLSNPSINLRVNGQRVLDIRDRFRNDFIEQAKVYAPSKKWEYGLLEINDQGLAPGTSVSKRLTIADSEEELYSPYNERPDKFYFDKEGLIQPYPRSGADANRWGVRATRGPQTPKYAAISVAQYNAVLGATLAFMSARANFLRAGPFMKALLHDFGADAFDPSVRGAMKYARDVGKYLPLPSLPARGPSKVPARKVAPAVDVIPGSVVPPPRRRPGKSKSAKTTGLSTTEKLLAGAAVGTAGYVAWKKLRKK